MLFVGTLLYIIQRYKYIKFLVENEENIYFEQILEDDNKKTDIRIYHNILFEGEADHLIERYKSRVFRSGGVGENGTTIYGDFRTSSSGFIKRSEDEVVFRIEERISRLLNTSISRMEDLQILNYKKGQKFSFHWDFFHNLDENGQQIHLNIGGQRYVSI